MSEYMHLGINASLLSENEQLKAENEKLRKELKQLQNGYGSMSREHSQTIVELSDAYFEIDRLKAENEQLRRLCKLFIEYVSQDCCEGCVCKSRCITDLEFECWMLAEIRELASELGMEVDE